MHKTKQGMRRNFVRETFDVIGTVQGVGFRPTVFRLASELGLGGSIQNRSGTVRLLCEGEPQKIEAFLKLLPAALPVQAKIEKLVKLEEVPLRPDHELRPFTILESEEQSTKIERRVSFPPDLAMCKHCLSDISNPLNRRYRYPFTTCTICGPRYTVINGMPYDRERTTLSAFPLCSDCLAEYRDQSSRRFHAESIACPKCGPKLWLLESDATRWEGTHALKEARRRLKAGQIGAVRGLGGFLLVLDGTCREAIIKLRARKRRPHKPLAVMARSLELIEETCILPFEAKSSLGSPAAPICILELGQNCSRLPVDLISPDTANIGFLLPYAPLHWLLFNSEPADPTPDFDFLVMTSGNQRAEPICISTNEAVERLSGIADFYLTHDREINLRADDSLCAFHHTSEGTKSQIWRRARGFAPDPIFLNRKLAKTVLATGAELKNTIALGYDDEVRLSPFIGDLETPEAIDALEEALINFPRFLSRDPELVVVDMHPDMQASKIGRKFARTFKIPALEVQHHHAHAAGCLAEHGKERGLALTFDGTGYGTDGSIWGAELLQVESLGSFKRLASFKAIPLPGGDLAVRKPARQLLARWLDAGIRLSSKQAELLGVSEEEASLLKLQIARKINCPSSHAAGRVFDACAAALGFSPPGLTYEGQAAVRLETAAWSALAKGSGGGKTLSFSIVEQDRLLLVDWSKTFETLIDNDVFLSKDSEWALAFHDAMAEAALRMIGYGLSVFETKTLALSGGVFMNRLLCHLLIKKLHGLGLEVLMHSLLPPNDGGLSFGQICAAADELARDNK